MQAEQVIQGLAVIEQFDQTDDLIIEESDSQDVRATRWLFTAGDTMIRQRKQETGFVYGGTEVNNRCLRRTGWGTGHYIPWLTFTPLEVWYEVLPEKLTSDVPGFNQLLTVKDGQGRNTPVAIGTENYHRAMAMANQMLFPGHQIRQLTEGSRGRICEVELKALLGIDYHDGRVQQLERLFWPDEFKKQALRGPVPIRLIRERLDEIAFENSAEQVQSLVSDMRRSCDLFESWANDKIGENHTNLRTRTVHHHTYRYDPIVIENLLGQMEVPREDTAFNRADGGEVKDVAQILAERDRIADERQAAFEMKFQAMQASQTETQKTLTDIIQKMVRNEEKKR